MNQLLEGRHALNLAGRSNCDARLDAADARRVLNLEEKFVSAAGDENIV